MKVVLDHRETVAAGMDTFWFIPERRVRYIAGQFTELSLPHGASDDRGIRRWFTLSSSPTEPLIGITTSFAEKSSSFKRALYGLTPGTTLQLADAMGDFVLPKDSTIPLIFIAAGAGITPVRSMVKYLADRGEQRDIQLVYTTRHESELAFLPLFTAYSLQLTTIVTQPAAAYRGETGPLTPERILDITHGNDRSYIYFSGPELMVETFYKQLQVHGISPDRLIMDYFPGYPAL